MENYKEEINKLQTQLNELKSKIEKPQFEVGKWYKGNENSCVFSVLFYCTKVDGDKLYGYGLVNNNWTENNSSINIADDENECVEATPKEVEEALTKEAIKRYCKYKIKCLHGANNESIKNINIWKLDDKCLRYYSDGGVGCVFDNGTWATLIKTKTIDVISKDLSILSEYEIKEYLIKEKTALIETLNNL